MAIKKRGEKLKIFFYHTQDTGVGMWRMLHPMKWINDLGLAEVKMLPFYWKTHATPNWELYVKQCEKKGVQPTREQFEKNAKHYPKPISTGQIEKLSVWADVVVAMRRDMREHCALLMAIKHHLKKPLVLETDDFVHYVPPYNPGARYYRPGTEQTDVWATQQFQIAENVQVTTPGLKTLYQQLNEKITILPNCIDPDYWIKEKKVENNPNEIRIGWTGANAHWGDLRIIRNVIPKILDKYPQVTFHFIGQLPDWWYEHRKKGRIINHKFHNLRDYGQYLSYFNYDIGVAPLVDNYFNRGKSNIRWLEYSVNKTATVCSPVWAYTKDAYGVMKEGKNVMYALEPEEWENKLSKLVENETLRKKIGQQAFDDVNKYYNLKTRAKDYVDYYQSVFDNFVIPPDPT